ncbi:MarR family winged helix-turn-helix transcriptional regulator [Streptomyces longispororuber]|uniref:MarR family winged helix-turn-helix transcriptional regulator n=1 Tax=Streptomyces longispororuber TaxID=68230 RepID=UPI00210C5638|nr:MarR family winged helix-turn-helix transcriptional regulator [Streptomyces longispororuber]MCQ4214544.1 MarR family winged helix-turn-helix transcriptional regulator [Streptomyces longispororuber]
MTKPDDPACTDHTPLAARGGPVSLALARVARLHRTAAGRRLRGLGLYPGQEFVMMHLWDKGPVRQSELIKAVDLDPSTVTKMLQRLEQSGHVTRSPDPRDRRAVLVEATDASCGLLEDVAGVWAALEEQTLAGLSELDRAEFVRLLGLVEGNLCTEAEDCPD